MPSAFDYQRVVSRAIGLTRSHAVQVVAILAFLTVWIFGATITGETIPPFDFVAAYNSEDFAWWGLGGVFNPPDWMPYLWGGYPSSSNLQTGAWYLPVGLMSALVKYDLHAAAILQVAHVVFSAVGMYILARRLGRSHQAGLIGMIAWYFCGPFFWTAQLVDFVRGFVWIPWLLLIFSHGYPWHRWWSILVAAVVISQSALGTYPGILVAFVYTIPIWYAFHLCLRPRSERWDVLIRTSVAVAAAGVFFLLKLVPFLLTRGMSYTQEDALTFGPSILGTAFFAPQYGMLPFPDFHFYSLFLPCVIFILCCWVPVRDRVVQATIVTAAVALSLSISTLPWHQQVAALPGTNLSRFPFSDFRVPLLAVVTVAGMFGYDRLVEGVRNRPRIDIAIRIGLSLIVVSGALTAAVRMNYIQSSERWQLLLLVLSVVVVSAVAVASGSAAWTPVAGALLVGATIGSGVVSATAQRPNWASDRAALEITTFGAEIDSFIDSPVIEDATRRPARDAPHDFPAGGGAAVEGGQDKKYSKSFYTGDLALFGWVNLRATAPYGVIKSYLNVEQPGEINERALDFWRSPGIMIEYRSELPSSSSTQACVDTGQCGQGITVTPRSYGDNGSEFAYRVSASHDVTLAANEAHYSGWSGLLCPADQTDRACVPVEPYSSPEAAVLLDVPAGDWDVRLSYTLPGLRATWLFSGVVFLALVSHAGWSAHGERKRRHAIDPGGSVPA